MTHQSMRQSSDQPQPYVSGFLMLPLRTRAQALEDIARTRLRVHRRKVQQKTPPR